MKVCSTCGATYKIHIDFCFVDGDVLGAAPDAMDAPAPGITGSFPQGSQVQPEGPPSIVPVEPPEPEPKSPPTPPPSKHRKSKHGTLVPGLGSEELDEEAKEALAAVSPADAPTDVPTDVPLVPPSSVATDVPSPTRPDTGTPAPRVNQAANAEAPDRRLLLAGLVVLCMAFVFVMGTVAVFGFNVLGRDTPPTVIEPTIHPKVVPPTPAEPQPAPAPEDVAPAGGIDEPDGEGTDDLEAADVDAEEELEGEDEEPIDEDVDEGVDEEVEEVPAPAPVPPPKPQPMAEPGVPAAPAPAPKAAPETPAPKKPAPKPAPAAGPKPAPQPKPEPTAQVWSAGSDPEPVAPAAKKGPVMIFFAGRVGDSVSVDGKLVGNLPAKATLANGEHTFTVEGAAGKVTVKHTVALNPDGQTTILQLSN